MNKLVAAVIALGGFVAVQAFTAATVDAHAVLESSTPADGAMLTAAPDLVEFVFSENVGEPAALAVVSPEGDEVEGGELQIVDTTMRRSYDPASFAPGIYTVSYQVTSADGHPISGSLTFMVHGDAGAAAEMTSAGSGDATDADPATVALLAAALAVALGVAFIATRRLISQPAGHGAE